MCFTSKVFTFATQARGSKQYELTDHLGNIRTVVPDIKEPLSLPQNQNFRLPTLTLNNYYPYGMLQAGRTKNAGGYRFGYQGQEADNKIGGLGQHLNYTFRNYDSWIIRFGAIDPLAGKYPYWSPFAFSGNRVIDAVELEGLEPGGVRLNALNNDTAPETGGSSPITTSNEASTTPTPIVPSRPPSTPTPSVRPTAPTAGATAGETGTATKMIGSVARVIGMVGVALSLRGDERITDTEEEEKEELVTIYRGVNSNAGVAYENALKGIVIPRGGDTGHTDPYTHNNAKDGTLNSQFTSWSYDKEVALNFAYRKGGNGVVLTLQVPKSRLIESPDLHTIVLLQNPKERRLEQEVLIQGTILNAYPEKVALTK